jgi:DNA-binding MarR family transcriptional regulator
LDTDNKNNRWLGQFIPYLIYRITGQLNRNLRKKLRRSGINIARWRVLAVLRDHGRLNIGQIAEETLIEQPTVSRIVNQLEKENLAVRESAGIDMRFVQVSLTPQGQEAFNEIYPIAVKHQQQALMDFEPQEIDMLMGYLRRIQNNISTEQNSQ